MSESGSKHVEAASEYHYVPQTTAPPAYQAHQPAHAASTTTSALPFNPADVAQLFRVCVPGVAMTCGARLTE